MIASLLIFNARNIIRINKEIKIYNFDSFPFFYVPKIDFKLINLNEDINIYAPIIGACWAIKTPCSGVYPININVKKIFGFNIFLNKDKSK